jgi:hypothetical protein
MQMNNRYQALDFGLNPRPCQTPAEYWKAGDLDLLRFFFDWFFVLKLVEIEYCDFIGLKKCRR